MQRQKAETEILGWNKEMGAQHLTRNARKYWECFDGRKEYVRHEEGMTRVGMGT